MRCPKATSIDVMFDQPKEFDDSVVASMYRQLQASTKEASFEEFMLANELIPQDTLSILNGLNIELPNHLPCNTVIQKPVESVVTWDFFSSDFEPTPIKPDLHEERVVGSFQDKSWDCPDAAICTASDHCHTSSTENWLKRKSPTSHTQRKRSKSRDAKKRKSEKPSFRPYQEQQFLQHYEELLKFKEEFGHCLVSHTYKENRALSRWVKRQRYQYKMLQQNKQEESTMTQQRISMLESIGFVWDSHKLAWQDRLKELENYKDENGDCNVTSTYRKSPSLATWVKCQRRQYKRFQCGEASNLSQDRIASLDALGFNWQRRH